ncbi:hypothetical protein CFP56_010129 [Quercus suber]|uniref:Uncharacterized protein n=1 Tax=Quercus suber TaxID=58331 RepID=A0AAW0L2H9_QUESU
MSPLALNILQSQALVNELIDTEAKSWKTKLVRQVFFPRKANIILGLPVSTALPNNALILTAPIGKFSIRMSEVQNPPPYSLSKTEGKDVKLEHFD